MKEFIHIHTICYNELNLMPHFLRHYSFADQIFVHDNFSTDGTREYLADKPNVTVLDYDSGGELRDDLHLERKNNDWKSSRGKSEWVIVCDVDEFIYSPSLIQRLQQIPQDVAMIQAHGMQMVSENFVNSDNLLVEDYRMGFYARRYDKVCLFRPDSVIETDYSPGCHKCKATYEGKLLKSDIKLLHYSHLGREVTWDRLMVRKERLSEINIKNKWGKHYKVCREEFDCEFDAMITKSNDVLEVNFQTFLSKIFSKQSPVTS